MKYRNKYVDHLKQLKVAVLTSKGLTTFNMPFKLTLHEIQK